MRPSSDPHLPRHEGRTNRGLVVGALVLATGVGLLLASLAVLRAEDREAAAESATPAPGAARYLVAISGRDVHDVVAGWPTTSLPPGLEGLSRIPIPSSQDRVLDGFHYRVIEDPQGGRFWVEVTGGFAGLREYRGPARLGENGRWVLIDAEDGGNEGGEPGS